MAKTTKARDGKFLVIVESPAKCKTINKYLGSDYIVKASMGHIRDLPPKTMGIDIENDFTPSYEISANSKKTITELKKIAKSAPKVFLATDMDREGEAIAWHLSKALELEPERQSRVVFNQITRKAIEEAFANAHDLNINRVNAQQARRILDRLVGYEISPLLWKKVARGLSAGRVQSVAVKIVVMREKEIRAFIPEEYWKTGGIFTTLDKPLYKAYQAFLDQDIFKENPPTMAQKSQWMNENSALDTNLTSVDGKTHKPTNQPDAKKIDDALVGCTYKVKELKTRRSKGRPAGPFITSTIQQQAANRLGFATKRTMRIAQQLYEGVKIGGEGNVGLITYMRTDSTHLAPEAITQARDFITENFGNDYLPEKPVSHGSSNKKAQEAHEAIRPTNVNYTPESIQNELNEEQFKLYNLIWCRYVACQMSPSQWDVTSVTINTATSIGEALFKTSGRVLIFDGFMRVSGLTMSPSEQILPQLTEGQTVNPIKVASTQHFTSPPPRYTEASLVKRLEADGIGRPSTYASIISTIQDRGYVEQLERKFHATDLGIVVTDKLEEFFPRVMGLEFTSKIEEQLDEISEEGLDWIQVLKDWYGPFKINLDRAHEEMVHAKAETQPSEYECEDCKSPLVYRFGKNGRFLSCSAYPTCKFSSPCDRDGVMCGPEVTDFKCPNCEKPMILRKGRFGTFLGCSGYPDCKTTQQMDKEGLPLPPKAPPKPSGIRCYKCTGDLVIRESKRGPFLGCGSFPKCRTIISMKQFDNLVQLQKDGIWPPGTWEEADELLGRKKKKKADDDDDGTTKTKKKTVKKKVAKKKTTKKATKKKTAKKTAKKKTATKMATDEIPAELES